MPSTIKIIFLGTSGSYPSPRRSLPSVAVQLDSEVILFDCGEGTQRQLMLSRVSYMKISKIFVSHLHGDHILGIPGLVQSMSLNDRKDLLYIYGPKGTTSMLTNILSLGYYTPTFPIQIQDLSPNAVLKFNGYSVYTALAEHQPLSLAYSIVEDDLVKIDESKKNLYGLSSEEVELIRKTGKIVKNGKVITIDDIKGGIRKGRKIVYTGDSAPTEEIVKLALDADVLIHEASVDSSLEEKANKYGHSSARQAAEVAKKANVRYLFLFHVSPRYKRAKILEEEAKKIFPNTYLPDDLYEFLVRTRKEDER